MGAGQQWLLAPSHAQIPLGGVASLSSHPYLMQHSGGASPYLRGSTLTICKKSYVFLPEILGFPPSGHCREQ